MFEFWLMCSVLVQSNLFISMGQTFSSTAHSCFFLFFVFLFFSFFYRSENLHEAVLTVIFCFCFCFCS